MSPPDPPAVAPAAPVRVRPATREDLPAVAKLAAELVRLHHGWDPQRFMLHEPLEEGYAWFFGEELARAEAVILVATRPSPAPAASETLLGYAYGALEPRDWNALREACGALHDIFVDPAARGGGVALALLEAFGARMRALGAPRVVLYTAWQNESAQKLFRRAGYRPTMIEMTRELGDAAVAPAARAPSAAD